MTGKIIYAVLMDTNDDGIVYLVGAGPGDAGLITVRGADCLRRADVVVYDNLANPELLRYAPATAELIYAGKIADLHTKSQAEINEILADRARRGLTVVRLKGGDPFLYGRGGEEAAWLVGLGIRWQVVPGISSAIAVPAYAGIPVTHRTMTGSVHVVTGHENMEGVGPDVDWSLLAKARGTIVVLMGVKNLAVIARRLIEHGLSGATPAAMIRSGSLAEQETLVSRLDKIAEDVATTGLKPPAVCVIGEVVDLRETLAWAEQRPLSGMRIAVTRPSDENDSLAGALDTLGAEVVRTPTLMIVPRSLDVSSRQTFERLGAGDFDWVVLTSANGVRLFARLLADENKDARWLAGRRLAAIGARTAEAMRAHGLMADVVVADSRQEGMADALLAEQPGSVLIARAAQARPVLEDRLNKAGVQTAVLPLYDATPDPVGINRLKDLLGREKIHAVTFTSARTFEALAESAAASDMAIIELLGSCAIAVIGPVTRAAVEQAGVAVAIESDVADMKALAQAIARWNQLR